jgi:hypothetical protein
MGIAAGMKDIVQDIVSSRDARVAEVKGLKKEANEMLGSFKASHKKTGAQLRRELADDKAKMGAEIKAMRSGFQSSRKEMSSVLKKDLAEHTQAVSGEVARLRQEIGASHQDISAKLRKDLAQGRADRESGVKEMRSEFRKSQAEVRSDIDEARTAWQELTPGVKKAAVKATPRVVRAEVEKTALKQEETPDLEAKLLAAIRKHPEGITLTEVAGSLGVAPVVFGRVSRKLLGEGKIRKADKAYFSVRAE